MKRYIIFFAGIILFMMPFGVNAQIEKKTFIVSGSSGILISSKGNSVDVYLKGGYFLVKNLGLGLSYIHIDEEDNLGGFARYYIKGKFITGIEFSRQNFYFEGGYAGFINRSFAIEPVLAVVSQKNGTASLQFKVGLSLFLNRGKIVSDD